MLSFKIVKMTKGLLAKKCARKIVNCYRMLAELQAGRALDKAEILIASSAPGHKHLRHLEASDLATEVTPKASIVNIGTQGVQELSFCE